MYQKLMPLLIAVLCVSGCANRKLVDGQKQNQKLQGLAEIKKKAKIEKTPTPSEIIQASASLHII